MEKEEINNWLKRVEKDSIENEYYQPKKSGYGKSVTFEIDGLTKTYCTATQWCSGEGYDFAFQTLSYPKLGIWEDKRISLHIDELDCLFATLKDLKYFGE